MSGDTLQVNELDIVSEARDIPEAIARLGAIKAEGEKQDQTNTSKRQKSEKHVLVKAARITGEAHNHAQ